MYLWETPLQTTSLTFSLTVQADKVGCCNTAKLEKATHEISFMCRMYLKGPTYPVVGLMHCPLCKFSNHAAGAYISSNNTPEWLQKY